MKLDNFKELLSKKAEGNSNLKLLIKYMRDDYLVDHVVESLEKMAASYSKKNPNAAVKHFATNMNKFKSGMIHDALSHHASHYKAALNSGDTDVANQHMRQIFKTMHLADKFTKDGVNDHSGGRLKISAIDPKPWERSGYDTKKKGASGQELKDSKGKDVFSTDTRGWGRHVSDYKWLQGKPHDSYGAETSRHGHDDSYPLEEIKVNDKHVHIDDIEHQKGKFNEHPFDSHPIFNHYSKSPKAFGEDHKAKYLDEREKYHTDEKGGKAQYRDKLANMSKEDWASRGSQKADRIHAPAKSETVDVAEDVVAKPVDTPMPGKTAASGDIAAIMGNKND